MKKYFALLICLILCLGIVGCKHECVFEEGWVFDEDYHWRECEDGLCEEYVEKDGHVFDDGYCTVCNKQSPNFVNEKQWYDALNLSEEDFQLEYTFTSGDEIESLTITRKGDYVKVAFGKEDSECYYLVREKDEYFRYDYVEDTWTKTDTEKIEFDSFVKIEFKDFVYEWFAYDQKEKNYYVEIVDKNISEKNYDITDAKFEFKDKKLVAIKYNKVYGSYEESYKAKIVYEKIELKNIKTVLGN